MSEFKQLGSIANENLAVQKVLQGYFVSEMAILLFSPLVLTF